MDLSLNALRAAYAAGTLDPHRLCALIDARAEACTDDNIWIHRLTAAERDARDRGRIEGALVTSAFVLVGFAAASLYTI